MLNCSLQSLLLAPLWYAIWVLNNIFEQIQYSFDLLQNKVFFSILKLIDQTESNHSSYVPSYFCHASFKIANNFLFLIFRFLFSELFWNRDVIRFTAKMFVLWIICWKIFSSIKWCFSKSLIEFKCYLNPLWKTTSNGGLCSSGKAQYFTGFNGLSLYLPMYMCVCIYVTSAWHVRHRSVNEQPSIHTFEKLNMREGEREREREEMEIKIELCWALIINLNESTCYGMYL